MNLDLAIRGGTTVLEDNVEVTDIGIKGGTIAAVGPDVGPANRDIDAREMIVLPGGIDPHVHLRVGASSSDLRFADDFASGSRAAAAGGLTTIGVMTSVGSDETPDRAINASVEEATTRSLIDFVLHPEIENPSTDSLEGLRDLWRQGFPSVKIYMMLGDFQSRIGDYARVIREASQYGVVVMVHCEWGPLLQAFQSHLIAYGDGMVNNYPRSRPTCVELTATEWAVALGRATGARIYVVHLSSAVALAACKRARADGVAIYVETRPLYLYFDDSVFTRSDAGLFVGNPPIRKAHDRRTLWSGLLNNEIDTVGSDHVSRGRAEKLAPDIDVTSAVPGVPELDTTMAMLYTYGVVARGMSLTRFAELTATNAARILNLYPQKGVLAVGSDGDCVILDPRQGMKVSGIAGHTRSDFCLYDEWGVKAVPMWTIRRGEVVFHRGEEISAQAGGRLIRRHSRYDEA